MTPDESLDLLREAHREPIDDAHYAAVRARVLAQIAVDRRRFAWRVWGASLAAVGAALACLAFWPRVTPLQPARQLVVPQVASASVSRAELPRPEPVKSHGVRRKSVVTGVVGPPIRQPLVVKMITDDPNVVIYWLAEGTGE